MASIYKRAECNTWQAQFYVTDPNTGEMQKVRRSTGSTNKKRAQEIANELERSAKGVMKGGSEEAQRAKSLLADAVAEIERETFTAPTARHYLSKLLQIATKEDLQKFTVESWAAEWIRRKARTSSVATMKRYRHNTQSFLKWLGAGRAGKPLESITALDARRWRELLQDSGRAGKTVLSYTKDVSAVFRAAIREGLISHNPFAGLEAVDTSDSQQRKPFTGEEVGKLLAAAPSEEWRGLVLTAAFTGLRLSDAARMRWSAVDLEAKRISLMPTKTEKKKREVRIPIQPDLLAYLLAAPVAQDTPNAPVFPTLAKKKPNGRNGLSAQAVALMAAAGVDRGKPSRQIEEGAERGAGRVTWERGFHSLRHTFTSWLRNAGVSEEDRMALTGHSTRDSHAIYSHADESALRKAISKLPTLPKP